MTDIEEIKLKIAGTETKLADAEKKLADAEAVENEMKIQRCREDVRDLRALLTKQIGVWENLLANQGKLTILSLLIAYSNPLYSAFSSTYDALQCLFSFPFSLIIILSSSF